MLLALIGLPSCSDEDNELSATGRISFYGENYLLEQGAIYHDNNHTVIAVTDYTFEDRYQGEDGEKVDQVKGFSAEVTDGQFPDRPLRTGFRAERSDQGRTREWGLHLS